MKKIKTYDNFINENSESFQMYHGVHPKTLYEYIVVLQNRKVKGFATLGFRTEEMIKNKVYAIGTIYGPGLGNFLYPGVIQYYGPIIPTANESDRAKMSWEKKFDSPKWKKYKIEGIGFYDRYKQEDYLNYVYEIDIKLKIKELDETKFKDIIYKEVNRIHRITCDNLEKNKDQFYTIGQSRERDKLLTTLGKNPEEVEYKK